MLLGAALLLVTLVGAMTYRALTDYRDAEQWVRHTYDVLHETDGLPGSYERLRGLTRDNAAQQRRLDAMRPLLSAGGPRLTQLIEELRTEELYLLRDRTARTDRDATAAAVVTILGMGGLFAFLAAAAVIIRRDALEYRYTVESNPQIPWTADEKGRLASFSDKWLTLTGMTRAAALGEGWRDVVHPDDLAEVSAAWRRAVETGEPHDVEYRVKTSDGSYRWMRSRAFPRKNKTGQVVWWYGTTEDISEAKRAAARFRELADNISQFAWMADETGSIFWHNRRWYDYTNTTPEEVEGWGWQRVHHPDHVQRVVEKFRAALAAGEPWEDVFPLRGKDGGYRWFLSRAVPIRDESGGVVRWFGTNTDVTEQLRIERTLRSFYDSTPLMMGVVETTDSDILHVEDNRAAREFFRGDKAGRWARALGVPPREIQAWLAQYGQARKTGRAIHFEFPFTRGQEAGVLSVYVSFIQIAESGRPRFSYVAEDATERKRAEEAAERWRRVFESASFGLSQTDVATNTMMQVNEAFARDRGYTPQEMAGRSVVSLYTPEEQARLPALLAATDAAGHLVYESEHERRDGTRFPVVMDVTTLRDSSGTPVSRVSYARDITEARQLMDSLRASEERFRATFEQAAVGIALVGPQGDWERVNQRLCDIVGYTREELLRLRFEDITHPEDVEADWRQARAVLAGEIETYSMEKRYRRKQGSLVWVNLTVSAMRDAEGRPLNFIAVVEDISRRKLAESAIQNLTATLEGRVAERTTALQEANRELEAFGYSVSHDLRAPLRSMQGFSQALLEDYADGLPPTGRRYLQRIAAAAGRMDELIQDLLAYSRLSRAEIRLERVSMRYVLHEAMQQLEAPLRESRAQVDVREPLPPVEGHVPSLIQMFGNVISNAIKFVRPGEAPCVQVWAERRGRMVRIWVADNGIGIEREHQARIFEVFQRLHGTEQYGGTGIGLAIVRRGAERMGGTAGVESEPGKGSRFWVDLRIAEER